MPEVRTEVIMRDGGKRGAGGCWLAFDSYQAIDMDSSVFHFIVRRAYIYFHKLEYTHTHIY